MFCIRLSRDNELEYKWSVFLRPVTDDNRWVLYKVQSNLFQEPPYLAASTMSLSSDDSSSIVFLPLLSGQPPLSCHFSFPRGWPLKMGLTIECWKQSFIMKCQPSPPPNPQGARRQLTFQTINRQATYEKTVNILFFSHLSFIKIQTALTNMRRHEHYSLKLFCT